MVGSLRHSSFGFLKLLSLVNMDVSCEMWSSMAELVNELKKGMVSIAPNLAQLVRTTVRATSVASPLACHWLVSEFL